jgi:hypothetical protein
MSWLIEGLAGRELVARADVQNVTQRSSYIRRKSEVKAASRISYDRIRSKGRRIGMCEPSTARR